MDKIKLVLPSADYAKQISEYRREFLESGGSMDGAGPLRRFEDPAEWLDMTEKMTKRETCPEGYVIATQFLGVRESDDRLVGMIQVRRELNDFLREYAGHIGYSVRPSERRKGYAKQMLAEVLPYCREVGLDRVMVACIVGNEGSRKTIIANGGKYFRNVFYERANDELEQYWIEL